MICKWLELHIPKLTNEKKDEKNDWCHSFNRHVFEVKDKEYEKYDSISCVIQNLPLIPLQYLLLQSTAEISCICCCHYRLLLSKSLFILKTSNHLTSTDKRWFLFSFLFISHSRIETHTGPQEVH